MILLTIAASAVFAVISPPENQRPGAAPGSAPRRPAATPLRATPKSALGATVQRAERETATRQSDCYPHRQAWVSGEMNIRGRPSTAAPILGTTPPGESYAVLASHQGDVYCWLDIDLGWIAVTRFVSADKAQARAPASAPVASGSSARSSAGAASPVPAQPAIDAAVQGALNKLNALVVAPEHRCSPYDSGDYSYSQSVEPQIVNSMGGRIYGPYTGAVFGSTKETDIEHIVARSEAHDSGLCGAGAQTRKAFARDLLNLTLAAPNVNRHQKRDNDFAEWRPARNACWFADRIIKVRAKYRLTIDSREKAALQRTLQSCSSVDMR